MIRKLNFTTLAIAIIISLYSVVNVSASDLLKNWSSYELYSGHQIQLPEYLSISDDPLGVSVDPVISENVLGSQINGFLMIFGAYGYVVQQGQIKDPKCNWESVHYKSEVLVVTNKYLLKKLQTQCTDQPRYIIILPDSSFMIIIPYGEISSQNMGELEKILASIIPNNTSINSFSDVRLSHPNDTAISYLTTNNIVSGYPDGTFRPNNPINRAEFTKIIIGAVYDDILGSNCFPDVHDEWFAPFVCTAKENQIVGGYPDGTFKPEQNVSFAEASKIVANAFNLESTISTVWYEGYVRALSNESAIPLSVTSFEQKITRGEMAEMVYRLRAGVRDLGSKTYEGLGGVSGASTSSAASSVSSVASEGQQESSVQSESMAQEFPYRFRINTGWKDAWNFYTVEGPYDLEGGQHEGYDMRADLDLDRVERVEEPGGKYSEFLRVHFPEGGGSNYSWHHFGREKSGVYATALGSMPKADEVYLKYYVRFPEDFDFSLGGWLPGIGGGITTDGYGSFGSANFSIHPYWTEKGMLKSGAGYTHESESVRGLDVQLSADNEWHKVEISARMNTVPSRRMNGSVEAKYDGVTFFGSDAVQFRTRADDLFDSLEFVANVGSVVMSTVPKDMYLDLAGFEVDN